MRLRRGNPFVATLDTIRYSDIVRDAFDPRCIKCAEKSFQEIEKEFPESFMMKNIRYLLARRSGDATRIKEAIRTAYAPVGESYLKNRRDTIGSETVWRVKQRLELLRAAQDSLKTKEH